MQNEIIALNLATGDIVRMNSFFWSGSVLGIVPLLNFYFISLYFVASFLVLALHSARRFITLAPVLAWAGLLTFLIWQVAQIGWWVDWYGLKLNVALLGLVPAIMMGATITYALDGLRAARAYHGIVLASAIFSIAYSQFFSALGHFMPLPSVFVLSLEAQISLALALGFSSLATNLFYEAASRFNRILAMPIGFLGGMALFLPLYSFLTYGLHAGVSNIHNEIKEYLFVSLPAATVILVYGLMARYAKLLLPARPIAQILTLWHSTERDQQAMHESVVEAREQIGELRRLNQALEQEEKLRHHQMEHSPLAMIELDAQGRIKDFNPSAIRPATVAYE
jgi:hypothetical protein